MHLIFTCLRIISTVCMMQRGMRPWFLAKIIACSRVTFSVHLQKKTTKANGERCVDLLDISLKK